MAIFKVTAVPDFSQLKGEIAKLQSSPVTLGVNTRQANVNIKTTAKNVATAQEAFQDAGKKAQQSSEKAAEKVRDVGKAAKETSGFAGLMGDSFGRVAAKMALWQVMGNAIAGVKRSFTEALETMKDVDDEMVTIRKVTGATTEELNRIQKQAYDTASAYGVAADEYLNSVANFSRAGYGEQASALAELATKTQIVGDTDAETAQQFLLSMDAAYKYQGRIEQLTKVLDGANEIDNNYATSIEKIAEGLGKVAPIAAQAHVGADELTAAIGTITAVTQRSGTEAATALRALFLNIIGDTKTEIDEGVTWTTGEIAGLRDVIKLYAKDAYEAAQASGDVINPMKAIAGLSQSMKDGLLTEQKLMEMVSDIGGKLRTSQLLALIQNWDMYQSMLGDFADAAGSADKEVENALDSWTRKTEILHNKWTEFISNLVETDTIKGALDGVIGLVEFLDSDLGHLTLTIGGVTLAVVALSAAQKKIAASEAVTGIAKVSKALQEAIPLLWNYAAAKKAAQSKNHAAESALTFLDTGKAESLISGLKIAGWMAAVTLAIAGINKGLQMMQEATDYLNRSFAEFDSDIKDANDSLEENRARLAEIAGMEDVWQTDEILAEKAALEETNAELEKQIANLEKVKVAKAKLMVGGAESSAAYVKGGTFLGGYQPGGGDAWESKAESAEAYLTAIQGATELTDAQRTSIENLLGAMDEIMAAYEALKDGGEKLTDAQQRELDAYYALKSAYDWATGGAQRHVDALIDEATQAGYTGKALYDLVAAQITASNTKLNLSQQIAALRELSVQAGYTAQDIATVYAYANGAGTYQADSAEVKKRAAELLNSGAASSVSQAFNLAKKQLTEEAWGNLTSNYTPSVSGGEYSGGGGSSSGESALRKKAQAEIDALKKARDAETAVIDEQIEALKKQNEETERGEKLEELKLNILKKQDALLNARNERTVRQYNAATGQWEWVADPSKVKQAEEDLEDAKKDLRDYEREVELDLAISELEARKKAIEAAYQIKIDAWNDYLDKLADAVKREEELLEESKKNNQNNGSNNTGSNTGISAGVDSIFGDTGQSNLNKWKDTKAGNIIGNVTGGSSGKPNGIPSGTTAKDILEGGKKKQTGIPSGTTAKDILSGAGSKSSGSGSKVSQSDIERTAKGLVQTGKYKDYNAALKEAKRRAGVYDSGGVLHGLGGIKATMRDEMVLPPDVTAKMLQPSADARFRARVNELGGLYGETPVSRSVAASSDNRSYSDHSGPTYNVKGITLTEQQAEHLTVAQMCRMAHNVKPYGG